MTQSDDDSCLPPEDARFGSLIEMNPSALLADGLEDAYVGHTLNHHHVCVAVYDYQKCIDILVKRDGMDYEGADEFLQFNTLGAYVGKNGPLFISLVTEAGSHAPDSQS